MRKSNRSRTDSSHENSVIVTKLVEIVFTEEDRKNLKTLAKEVPKLPTFVESLIET